MVKVKAGLYDIMHNIQKHAVICMRSSIIDSRR